MNYGVGKKYSVFLMSVREGAPYADALDEVSGMLTYEGHDEPQRKDGPDPKTLDQPLTTPRRSWTENGKFFRAAMDFKSGLRERPELIKVYEKISRGIWSYKAFLRTDRCDHCFRWKTKCLQVLAEAGEEESVRSNR